MKTIAIHGSSGWLGRSTFYYLNSFDLNIEKFNDIKVGDVVEAFGFTEVKRTL